MRIFVTKRPGTLQIYDNGFVNVSLIRGAFILSEKYTIRFTFDESDYVDTPIEEFCNIYNIENNVESVREFLKTLW